MRPWVVALACVLVAGPALASPEDLFGFGARSEAMGGTGATFVDDYAAVYTNPASLSLAHESSFTFGFQGALYHLWTALPPQAATPDYTDPAHGTFIGLALPLPFGGILHDRIVLGLGFYTPTDVVVRGVIVTPSIPQFLVIGERAQSVAVQLGLGVSLPWGFRIGIGAAALAAIVGSVAIAADATGRFSSNVDDQLVATYAPILGLSWTHGPVRIAATYHGTLAARFAVEISAMDIGIPVPPLNIAGLAQYDPWNVGLEAAIVHGPVTFAVAATLKKWSEYPGPVEQTTPTSAMPPAPGFSDTIVLRAGGEYRWAFRTSMIAARAGYFYEQSPAPTVTSTTGAYLDSDRHVATAGLALEGHLLGTRVRTEFYGQSHFLVDRAGGGTDPVANPTIHYGGQMYALGWTITVTF